MIRCGVRRCIWPGFGLPLFAAVLAWAPAAWSKSVGDSLTMTEKRDLSAEARLVIELLQNLQYSDRQFHEIDGAEIVTRYLKALDPDLLVFTRDDVDSMDRRLGVPVPLRIGIDGDRPGSLVAAALDGEV